MRRYIQSEPFAIIEDLHALPDPLLRPMNGAYLQRIGYGKVGSIYSKGDVKIVYDGCNWWVYYFLAMFRIETIEDFEKLVLI